MLLRRVQLFAIPWTVIYQAPPSMEFSRQEYWSRLPFLSPGDLPSPGIKPRSPTLQADALPSESRKSLRGVRLFATPWTIESMEFSRPEYWSGWPFPSPGDLPNPGVKLHCRPILYQLSYQGSPVNINKFL